MMMTSPVALLALICLIPGSTSLSCYQCIVGHNSDGSLVYLDEDADLPLDPQTSCLTSHTECEDESGVGNEMRCVAESSSSDQKDYDSSYDKIDIYGCLSQTRIDGDPKESLSEALVGVTDPVQTVCATDGCNYVLSCYQCIVGYNSDSPVYLDEYADLPLDPQTSCLTSHTDCEDPSGVGDDMRCVAESSSSDQDAYDSSYDKIDIYGCQSQTRIDGGESLSEMLIDVPDPVQTACATDGCNYTPPALSCPTCKSPFADVCPTSAVTCDLVECESDVTECYTALTDQCEVERGCKTATSCDSATCVDEVSEVCAAGTPSCQQIQCPTCELSYQVECVDKAEDAADITCGAAECDVGVDECFSVVSSQDQSIRLGCKPKVGDYKTDEEADFVCEDEVCTSAIDREDACETADDNLIISCPTCELTCQDGMGGTCNSSVECDNGVKECVSQACDKGVEECFSVFNTEHETARLGCKAEGWEKEAKEEVMTCGDTGCTCGAQALVGGYLKLLIASMAAISIITL